MIMTEIGANSGRGMERGPCDPVRGAARTMTRSQPPPPPPPPPAAPGSPVAGAGHRHRPPHPAAPSPGPVTATARRTRQPRHRHRQLRYRGRSPAAQVTGTEPGGRGGVGGLLLPPVRAFGRINFGLRN